MSLAAKIRRGPMRVATGAFILSSGLDKLGADEATAKGVHGLASGTYGGVVGKIDPKLFVKGLGAGEIVVGGLLLTPFVSPVVAGAALVGFSGALVNLYWKTPGMHRSDSDPRPTQQGLPISKDVWMLSIGAALVADGLLEPAHDKKLELTATVHEKRNRSAKRGRKARKAARKASAQAAAHAVGFAHDTQTELSRRTRKALAKAEKSDAAKQAKATAKQARKATKKATKKASKRAAKTLAGARDEYSPIALGKAKQARDAVYSAAEEYGPVAVGKARDTAQHARDAALDATRRVAEVASDAADEYGPIAADKARQARDAARSAAERVQASVR